MEVIVYRTGFKGGNHASLAFDGVKDPGWRRCEHLTQALSLDFGDALEVVGWFDVVVDGAAD